MIALQPSPPSRARVISCSGALLSLTALLVLARSAAAGRAMPGSFPPEAGLGPKASRVTARIREELMPDFGMPHFQEFSLPELRGPQLPEPQMPQLQMPPLLSFDASPRQQPKRPTKSTKAQPPPANTAATPLAVSPSAALTSAIAAGAIAVSADVPASTMSASALTGGMVKGTVEADRAGLPTGRGMKTNASESSGRGTTTRDPGARFVPLPVLLGCATLPPSMCRETDGSWKLY
mmetsp:Transcript_27660/g.90710  ORF Transcript_27660/g.90710 Transcript_27660/m.90710 type:complete len:236 (+) Transcript_27660:67-774(+)